MSNLNNLTAKVSEQAKSRKEKILNEAQKEKETILADYTKKANEKAEMILVKAKKEAESKKNRIISSAELKVRNEILTEKQNKIDEIFHQAVSELSKLSEDKLISYIKKSIKSISFQGEAMLILGENTKLSSETAVVDEINSEISPQGKKIVLVSEKRKNKSGFIIAKGGVEMNYTFDALVNSVKDDVEYEVAKVLFN